MFSVLFVFTDSDYTFGIFKLFVYLIQFGSLLNQKLISLFSEVFAEDVNFTKEMECTDKTPVLTLRCQLTDLTRITDMYHIKIQQENIYEQYEDVMAVRFIPPNISVVVWYNDTIEKISSTEGSSVFPASESRLILQINSLIEDSMMFRCTISANGFVEELKQDLAVRKADAGKFC